MNAKPAHLSLACVFLALHSAAVAITWYAAIQPGCMSGIVWLPIAIADAPVALLIPTTGHEGLMFLFLGGVQWFLIGVVVQGLFQWIVGRMR
jgi:hypothetical protein